MAHSANEGINKLWGAYSERSTLRVQQEADCMAIRGITLSVPIGTEKFQFDIGQTVFATGEGTIVAGVKMIITDRHINNGYCRYYANGVWHNQQDIIK